MHSFNQIIPRLELLIGREVADWDDEVKRKAIYDQTQHLTQEYLPYIQLVTQLSLAAVRDRVQGVKYSALGSLGNALE